MWVTRFLFSLPSSHDGVRSQILGAKEHPSHGEFQSFRHVTLPSSIPSPTDRSALALLILLGLIVPLVLVVVNPIAQAMIILMTVVVLIVELVIGGWP